MESNINRDIESSLNGSPRSFDNFSDADNFARVRPSSERESWRVMFSHFTSDLSRLWDKEVRLIGTEVREKIVEVKAATISLGIGGAILFVGLFALVATAILGLSTVLVPWLAAAIVTGILFLIGGVMVGVALKKLDGDKLMPNQTIETLGEIRNTFKERVHEFTKH